MLCVEALSVDELFVVLQGLPSGALVPLSILVYLQYRETQGLRVMVAKLLEMHEHPEGTGFGTTELGPLIGQLTLSLEQLSELVKSNSEQTRALVKWVQWTAERHQISPPPPDVPG